MCKISHFWLCQQIMTADKVTRRYISQWCEFTISFANADLANQKVFQKLMTPFQLNNDQFKIQILRCYQNRWVSRTRLRCRLESENFEKSWTKLGQHQVHSRTDERTGSGPNKFWNSWTQFDHLVPSGDSPVHGFLVAIIDQPDKRHT